MVRLPVPKNRLVLFTLVGAVLTGAVAVGLAYPGAVSGDETTTATTPQDGADSVDAPAPNESFTPQVSDTGYGEEYENEYEGYEEDEHEEDEHDEEGAEYDEEDDEYEEYEEGAEYEEGDEEGYDD
jgi:hypothetical protein